MPKIRKCKNICEETKRGWIREKNTKEKRKRDVMQKYKRMG